MKNYRIKPESSLQFLTTYYGTVVDTDRNGSYIRIDDDEECADEYVYTFHGLAFNSRVACSLKSSRERTCGRLPRVVIESIFVGPQSTGA